MFLTYKPSLSAIVPVSLVSSGTGLPLTGVTSGTVLCTVVKADGSSVTVTVTGGIWTELNTGNTLNSGEYLLTLPSSALSLEGTLLYFVSTTGSDLYRGVIRVSSVDTTVLAIKAKTDNLPATPAGTTDITAAVTSIKGSGGVDNTMLAGSGFDTSQHSLAVIAGGILPRVLGMLHENSVLDQTTFDGNNNLTAGRLRLYNSKANADAATAASPGTYDTGKIAQYAVIATYTGTNLLTYEVSRVA